MGRNIEIKARVNDLDAVAKIAATLTNQEPIHLRQDDTFFACKDGRLKLRELSEHEGELIFYKRSGGAGPKQCDYVCSATTDPAALRNVLSAAYGESGRVRKERLLYLVGRTRVHLDRVENLGEFVELEVVLGEGELPESGVHEAYELMEKLGVDSSQLIDVAYVDLLVAKNSSIGL